MQLVSRLLFLNSDVSAAFRSMWGTFFVARKAPMRADGGKDQLPSSLDALRVSLGRGLGCNPKRSSFVMKIAARLGPYVVKPPGNVK